MAGHAIALAWLCICRPVHLVGFDIVNMPRKHRWRKNIYLSTPLPRKRSRTATKAQDPPPKRQAVDLVDTFNTDLKEKCLGEYSIPVGCLQEPPNHLLLRPLNQKHKERIKEGLKDTRSCSTVLPVLLVGETFEARKPEASKYLTLGGNHLAAAIKDLSDDSVFTELTTVRVKIYSGLHKTEALRVASLHNVGTHLVQGGNLSDSISVCRRLLYLLQGCDEELDEPPSSTLAWRESCGLSLGRKSPVCPKELKSLEPTFQLAQYSIRCYSKLQAVFEQHEQQTGQCLKQTALMKLQGLPEGTKFELLSEVVSGSLTVKEMGKEADKIKKLLVVQRELMAQLSLTSWDDAESLYPQHTKEKALQPFTGCNFKQGLPRPFMAFVRDAISWRNQQDLAVAADGEPPQMLKNDNCCAVFLSEFNERALLHVEGYGGTVAIIADMETSTSNLEDVWGIKESSGHIQGSVFLETSPDTISDVRRYLRDKRCQHITNLFSFNMQKKVMKSMVTAVWRKDGFHTTSTEEPDMLVDGHIIDHITQGIPDEEWVVDLTKSGEATLAAVKQQTNVVNVQPNRGFQRQLKVKVAALMQVRAEEESLSEDDGSTSLEDESL